jgi:hypothetical protein
LRGAASCPELSTELTLDEAHSVLEPYFLAVRAVFLEAGLTATKRVRFHVERGLHDTPRHFAACSGDGRNIYAAPELAEMPYETTIAILAHEFGHASDFLYPGEFALGSERVIRRLRDSVDEKQWLRWQKSWEGRSDDVVEITADKIAELVWGKPIGYLGPCLLQSFTGGVPRPLGLR